MGASGNPAKRAARERLRAEAQTLRDTIEAADRDAPAFVGTLEGKSGSVEITIPAILDWEDGALQAMVASAFSDWARLALSDEDYASWVSVRPTYRTITQLISDWEESTGEDAGEAQAS